MTIKISKSAILYFLFTVLAVFYAVNIFNLNSINSLVVDKPVKVSFILLEQPKDECLDCFNAQDIVNIIDASHNIKYKTTLVKYDTDLSLKYIEMYGIKNLPAAIVSGDIENERILGAWSAFSGRSTQDKIIIENLLPYYDIESGVSKGIISAILLKDTTCSTCFDENQYIAVLGRAGMVVGSTKVYDVASAEGREFVKKYNIKKIPAAIFSADANDYPGFDSSWKEVGTIEKDGWLVFREVQKLSTEYINI